VGEGVDAGVAALPRAPWGAARGGGQGGPRGAERLEDPLHTRKHGPGDRRVEVTREDGGAADATGRNLLRVAYFGRRLEVEVYRHAVGRDDASEEEGAALSPPGAHRRRSIKGNVPAGRQRGRQHES
jgi:hypothetical protein